VGCVNVRRGRGRTILYKLDGCGNVLEGATNKLVLDTVGEFTWEDTITDGDEVTERNFAGQKIYSDRGDDEITDIAVNLTHLGLNPSVEVFLTAATAKTDGGAIVGYGRNDLDAAAGVAVEVLVQLPADACAEGATAAPVAGWFFPLVRNWRTSGGNTFNGTDLLKPQFAGRGYKNENIFGGSVSDADFAKWSTIHVAGTEWYTGRVFDGETVTLPDASCEPVALS
jgi:hypothetical protein